MPVRLARVHTPKLHLKGGEGGRGGRGERGEGVSGEGIKRWGIEGIRIGTSDLRPRRVLKALDTQPHTVPPFKKTDQQFMKSPVKSFDQAVSASRGLLRAKVGGLGFKV